MADKNVWLEYERLKKQIPKDLSPKEYEEKIKSILKKLGLD